MSQDTCKIFNFLSERAARTEDPVKAFKDAVRSLERHVKAHRMFFNRGKHSALVSTGISFSAPKEADEKLVHAMNLAGTAYNELPPQLRCQADPKSSDEKRFYELLEQIPKHLKPDNPNIAHAATHGL